MAVYLYQNYLIIHFQYVQPVVYLSKALYRTYTHLLVVKIAAVFRSYAFIWYSLALVFVFLFGFGFCFYVSVFSKCVSISFESGKSYMVISVNIETDHFLDHQEPPSLLWLVSGIGHVSGIPLFQRFKTLGMLSGS